MPQPQVQFHPPAPVQARPHRSLQLALFITSITWAVAANGLASRAARGLAVRFRLSDEYLLLDALFLVFLLPLGFVALQGVAARNTPLRRTIGLPKRLTSRTEWATGAAIGWAIVLLAILPMAIARTLHVRFWLGGRSFGLVVLNVATATLLALASEMAFRGYPFQRLIESVGPTWATVVMAMIFALFRTFNQDATYLSTCIAFVFGFILCLAWRRTHGLWVGWGMHFAWMASLGILFGMPVMGVDNLSSAVQSRAIGPLWLTGGSLGPEGAAVTLFLLIVAIAVVIRMTRDWAWDYARKPLIPAGYPMDVPPPAAHTAMERQAAAVPALVQILPTTPQTRSAEPDH